jgi:hypothetical protein
VDRPLVSRRLGPLLVRRVLDSNGKKARVEVAKTGGGWTLISAAAAYRRDAPQAVTVYGPGGPVTQQRATFFFDPSVVPDVPLGARITDDDGVRWVSAGGSGQTEDEDVFTIVDAVRQG